MLKTRLHPNATETDTAQALPKEGIESLILSERRRFPRELPTPEVVELNSDSAWQAFSALQDPAQDKPQ